MEVIRKIKWGAVFAPLVALLIMFSVPTVRASADSFWNGFLRDAVGNLDVNINGGAGSAYNDPGYSTTTGPNGRTSPVCGQSIPISVSTSGSTQLVPANTGTTIHICHFDFVANGQVNVSLQSGIGTTCGTSTKALTGAYPLQAQSGVSSGDGNGQVTQGIGSGAVCVNLSAATQVSGLLTYDQY